MNSMSQRTESTFRTEARPFHILYAQGRTEPDARLVLVRQAPTILGWDNLWREAMMDT